MSPKEPLNKITLIQFLDQFAYKEEVQDILYSFDLPVSGTKDDLLQRLKRPLSSEDPTNILNKLSKDSLKNACDYYGLPVGGTKDALIDRILSDIITGKSPAVEKSTIKSEKIADKPTKNGSKKDQLYDILNGLSKSDIERGLKDGEDLVVCWKSLDNGENPRQVEAAMIHEFKKKYGKLPFANLIG